MSNETGLPEKTIQKLQSVFRKHPEIQSVTLYGSRAKGNYKKGSDIDLTLHAPAWSLRELLRLENEIDDLLLPYKVDLSLAYQIESQALLDHIQRVGKIFYRKKRKTPAKKKISKKRIQKSRQKPKPSSTPDTPIHPWRVCPYGKHQIIAHPRHNPPSKTHPAGSISTVRWHCARNPSGKDQLYPDEIREIAKQHFSTVKNKPCPLSLGDANGSKYDDFIAGWTQYWNEILKPTEPLDPNLVKALIGSESDFNPDKLANKKDPDSARGLMQVTNESREILDDDSGEIKDHYITVTRSELNDPNINICAGIRWLFHKRALLSNRLKRQATWLETVSGYKGTKKASSKKRAQELINRFKKRYEALQKCGKK